MKVKICTKTNCGHCKEAKEYFNKKKIPYTEVNLSIGGIPETIELKKYFKEVGITTVPVIVITDDFGGEMIIQEFDEDKLNQVFEHYVSQSTR